METYSRVTRFCIICNYVSRIIEPVASRCAKFRFRSLEPDVMLARLRYISDQEELKVSDNVLLGAPRSSRFSAHSPSRQSSRSFLRVTFVAQLRCCRAPRACTARS